MCATGVAHSGRRPAWPRRTVALLDKEELENVAAELVVAELGALRAERRDVPGAQDRTRDYDVVFGDGHDEPIEITTNLDRATMSALGRTDGGVLELSGNVKRLWMVTGSATYTDQGGRTLPFDRWRITELLPPLIEQLEQQGATELDLVHLTRAIGPGAAANLRETALELHGLGITHGGSIEVPRPDVKPGISVHLGSGGAWGPETITTVLEELAALPDNVAKLEARCDAPRRHLFVALSGRGSTDMAGWALQQFLDGDWIWEHEPPLPKLPDAITTIWAGNRTGGIYATPPDGWRRFGA